ncbi:hypothetical protein V8E53_010452 [Lactarius tabidus]
MSISAQFIAWSRTEPSSNFFDYEYLALATSLATLFTVIPMYLIDMFRQGAMFSYIIFEIVWLSILWVSWLSSGSYTAWTDSEVIKDFPAESSCNFSDSQGCREVKVLYAFSFLAGILLMVYTAVLLSLAIRAQGRGKRVWTVSVRVEAIFYAEARPGGTLAQMNTMPTNVPQAYPPAPYFVPTPGAVQV